MKTITTTVLKPHMAPNGIIVQRGAEIEVDEQRYRHLVKKGYVRSVDGAPDGDREDAKQPKGGITNADFKSRRQSIVKAEKPAE